MMDRSITAGGMLTDVRADEAVVLSDVLHRLRGEAERRGWRGARIVELRRAGLHRQIEIKPCDGWSVAIEDLRALEGRGKHDEA